MTATTRKLGTSQIRALVVLAMGGTCYTVCATLNTMYPKCHFSDANGESVSLPEKAYEPLTCGFKSMHGLEERGLVEFTMRGFGSSGFAITKKGRAYVRNLALTALATA